MADVMISLQGGDDGLVRCDGVGGRGIAAPLSSLLHVRMKNKAQAGQHRIVSCDRLSVPSHGPGVSLALQLVVESSHAYAIPPLPMSQVSWCKG